MRLFLRCDDVGDDDDEILDCLLSKTENLKIHCLLAVIPMRLTRKRALILKKTKYCTIFQHGLSHANAVSLGALKDEFPCFLGKEEITYRLTKGRRILEHALDLEINGYVPPWNHISPTCVQTLQVIGFRCVSGAIWAKVSSTLKSMPVALNVLQSYRPMKLKPVYQLWDELTNKKEDVVGVMVHTKGMSNHDGDALTNWVEEMVDYFQTPEDWRSWQYSNQNI